MPSSPFLNAATAHQIRERGTEAQVPRQQMDLLVELSGNPLAMDFCKRHFTKYGGERETSRLNGQPLAEVSRAGTSRERFANESATVPFG